MQSSVLIVVKNYRQTSPGGSSQSVQEIVSLSVLTTFQWLLISKYAFLPDSFPELTVCEVFVFVLVDLQLVAELTGQDLL